MIWKNEISVELLNNYTQPTIVKHLGIEFTEVGDDFLKATMPVDERTKQPLGLLHGGASCVLAETLGSVGATFAVDRNKQYIVGVDINANHIRAVKEGFVTGIGIPLHIGRKTQVWEMKMTNPEGKLSCVSRLTVAVLDK